MSTADPGTDPTMAAIGAAVESGHRGDIDRARSELAHLWTTIGPAGDPLHRCTLAHHLADLHADPAQALVWDIRALDAADALTDARVHRHHEGLSVAGFYPSLHLNLADDYRLLGSFGAAADHIAAARERLDALPEGGYGRLIRRATEEVGELIEARSTRRRPSAPGVAQAGHRARKHPEHIGQTSA
ncbi:hypothetical protein [Nocardia veterana]|uniref:Tetratricopeptide repeat protein n=1 Tax=Nocardia veterana TaxID=132249 RepID=A0A7X6RGM3_9NOCA|nr:hypothetical protein [Nocardia veterana]NKY85070.1 hypothetical protein [Nocardia veterana]